MKGIIMGSSQRDMESIIALLEVAPLSESLERVKAQSYKSPP
jgi:hypothetical protein